MVFSQIRKIETIGPMVLQVTPFLENDVANRVEGISPGLSVSLLRNSSEYKNSISDKFRPSTFNILTIPTSWAWQLKAAVPQFEEQIKAAEKIQDEKKRAEALTEISLELSKAKVKGGRAKLFEKLIHAAEQIQDPDSRAIAIGNIESYIMEIVFPPSKAKLSAERTDLFEKLMQAEELMQGEGSLVGIALELSNERRSAQTILFLEKVVITAEKLQDEFSRAYVLAMIAPIFMKFGQQEKAIKTFAKAMEAAEKIEEARRAEFIIYRADELLKPDKYRNQRLPLVAQLIHAAEKIQSGYYQAETLVMIAFGLSESGQTDEAKKALEKAIPVAVNIQDDAERTEVLNDISLGLFRAGEQEKGLEIFKSAAEIASKIQDDKARYALLSKLLFTLTVEKKKIERNPNGVIQEQPRGKSSFFTASEVGKLPQTSLPIFEKLTEIAEKIQDPPAQAEALGRIAAGLSKTGLREKALAAFEKALAVARQDVTALTKIASLLSRTGFQEEAYDTYEKAIDSVAQSTTSLKDYLIGTIADQLSQEIELESEKTLSLFEKLTEVATKIENDYEHHMTLLNIGTSLAKLGQQAKAEELLRKTIETAKNIQDEKTRKVILERISINILQSSLANKTKTSLLKLAEAEK